MLGEHITKYMKIADAYEETLPSSCSSCNLAIKYTLVVALFALLIISLAVCLHYNEQAMKGGTGMLNRKIYLLYKNLKTESFGSLFYAVKEKYFVYSQRKITNDTFSVLCVAKISSASLALHLAQE